MEMCPLRDNKFLPYLISNDRNTKTPLLQPLATQETQKSQQGYLTETTNKAWKCWYFSHQNTTTKVVALFAQKPFSQQRLGRFAILVQYVDTQINVLINNNNELHK